MNCIIQNGDILKAVFDIIPPLLTVFGGVKGWQWFSGDTVPDFKFSSEWMDIFIGSLICGLFFTIIFSIVIGINNSVIAVVLLIIIEPIVNIIVDKKIYKKKLSTIIGNDKEAKADSIYICIISVFASWFFTIITNIIIVPRFSNVESIKFTNIISCIDHLAIAFIVYEIVAIVTVELYTAGHRQKKYSIAEITYDDGDFVKVRYTKRIKRNDMFVFERIIWDKKKESSQYYSYVVNPSKVKSIFFKSEDDTDIKGLTIKDSDVAGKESKQESVSKQSKDDTELSNSNEKKVKC